MRERAIRRRFTAVATISAGILLAAACGDDGSGTADPVDTVDDATDTADDDTADDHDHDDDMAADGHDHATIEAGDVVPSIEIEVWADPAGGVNISARPSDFTIAPESASTEHVDGEGHLHLHVDGEKVLRYYNECIYWPGVDEGPHTFTVELSANDHSAYAVNGEPIVATVDFEVPAHSHDDHSHDDPVAVEWDGSGPPALAVDVVDDPKSGWNVSVDIAGLDVSCEHASGDHVAGEGHLHIYADGQKLGRLYGPHTHLAALPEGEVEIRVAAYTNDHRPYVVDGAPVEATTTVVVEDGS